MKNSWTCWQLSWVKERQRVGKQNIKQSIPFNIMQRSDWAKDLQQSQWKLFQTKDRNRTVASHLQQHWPDTFWETMHVFQSPNTSLSAPRASPVERRAAQKGTENLPCGATWQPVLMPSPIIPSTGGVQSPGEQSLLPIQEVQWKHGGWCQDKTRIIAWDSWQSKGAKTFTWREMQWLSLSCWMIPKNKAVWINSLNPVVLKCWTWGKVIFSVSTAG